jgi:hypothetical protein
MRGTGVFLSVHPLLHSQIAGHTKDSGIVAFHVWFFQICKWPRNYIEDISPVIDLNADLLRSRPLHFHAIASQRIINGMQPSTV